MIIQVTSNSPLGQNGYLKSVNYNKGSFSVTKNAKSAKRYKDFDAVAYDIDYCSRCNPLCYFVARDA